MGGHRGHDDMTATLRRTRGVYIPRVTGAPYDLAVLADTPALYWKLADAVGTTAPVDSSGNARDASISGTVTFGGTALVGSDSQTSATFATSPAGRVRRSYESWLNGTAFSI